MEKDLMDELFEKFKEKHFQTEEFDNNNEQHLRSLMRYFYIVGHADGYKMSKEYKDVK